MGRSRSCFQIITCSSNEPDKDDLNPSEDKNSNDKRGWSFRKRSARHRVLSNTVITSGGNKEISEPVLVQSHLTNDSGFQGKTSLVQLPEEKTEMLGPVNSKATETDDVTWEDNKKEVVDHVVDDDKLDKLDESGVVAVQSAIRGFLAQKELLKHQKVVKLQAAVRGHLVRRQAAGTLRCVQAIVKMQLLVRARCSEKGSCSSVSLEKKNSATTQKTSASLEKLLSNKFARQLLESEAQAIPIHVKCDPSKPSSAWNWLERWMSVSTPKPDPVTEQPEIEKTENVVSCETLIPKPMEESVVKSEGQENLVRCPSEKPNFYECNTASFSVRDDDREQYLPTSIVKGVSNEFYLDAKSEELVHKKFEPVSEEELVRSVELDTEEKKLASGSRKITNPAFIAAQSKFKELSSTSAKSVSLSNQEILAESKTNTVSSEAVEKPTAASVIMVHYGSECGTELSISSTLDSPDRSEAETRHVHENETETKDTDHDAYIRMDKSDFKAKEEDQTEKHDWVESDGSVVIEQKMLEINFTPEASPRSHITVPESSYQTTPDITVMESTPNSQVMVKPTKKDKTENPGLKHKRKSLSSVRKSPSNPKHDSGAAGVSARSSVEQLLQDQRNVKRRDSLGSPKPENADQEPRDSNSSNSVPRFMQATKSAKAKIYTNSSPRSSPEAQEGEVFIKKRHSLPGTNGRQVSPRIQRSKSQAQQGTKEKKWQR